MDLPIIRPLKWSHHKMFNLLDEEDDVKIDEDVKTSPPTSKVCFTKRRRPSRAKQAMINIRGKSNRKTAPESSAQRAVE